MTVLHFNGIEKRRIRHQAPQVFTAVEAALSLRLAAVERATRSVCKHYLRIQTNMTHLLLLDIKNQVSSAYDSKRELAS